jgi:UTP--glucose-1-phosphate uridylyltransferase
MIRIKKAIIPAAGLGSRVRSISKNLPKEMLFVGTKPMIQHAVEMHAGSGVEQIAVILHPEKEMIRDFLEGKPLPHLTHDSRDKTFYNLLAGLSLQFFYQKERRGVVEAVLLARDFIDNEPFSLIMPDCLLFSDTPFIAQLIAQTPPQVTGVIGFIMLEQERAHLFGNVGLLQVYPATGRLYRIVELSDKAADPVKFSGAVHAKGFGGGIYTPDYFDYVQFAVRKHGSEVDDVPIHQEMAARSELFGVLLEGMAFDAGTPEGYHATHKFCTSGKLK